MEPVTSLTPDADSDHESESVAEADVEEAAKEIVISSILSKNHLQFMTTTLEMHLHIQY